MLKVIFSLNIRNEAWNWVRVGKTRHPQYGRRAGEYSAEIPRDVLREIRRRSKAEARQYVFRYLRRRQKDFEVDAQALKALLDEYMHCNGTALLKEVARLTQKPLYRQKFFVNFTLLSSCPYYFPKAWFMIALKRNFPQQLKIICHEILHLQFIHYYHRYCLDHGLTEKQFQDLKEAMTVLLNQPQFRKYHLGFDRGYTDHVLLRRSLERRWRRHEPYLQFLDACIAQTKKQLPDRVKR